jgi:hypothetical protein
LLSGDGKIWQGKDQTRRPRSAGARGRQRAAGEAYVRSENGVKFVPMS